MCGPMGCGMQNRMFGGIQGGCQGNSCGGIGGCQGGNCGSSDCSQALSQGVQGNCLNGNCGCSQCSQALSGQGSADYEDNAVGASPSAQGGCQGGSCGAGGSCGDQSASEGFFARLLRAIFGGAQAA